jgi:hypothetical protein
MGAPVRRFHVYLTELQAQGLEHEAEALGLKRAEVLRRAVDAYLGAQAVTLPPTVRRGSRRVSRPASAEEGTDGAR